MHRRRAFQIIKTRISVGDSNGDWGARGVRQSDPTNPLRNIRFDALPPPPAVSTLATLQCFIHISERTGTPAGRPSTMVVSGARGIRPPVYRRVAIGIIIGM